MSRILGITIAEAAEKGIEVEFSKAIGTQGGFTVRVYRRVDGFMAPPIYFDIIPKAFYEKFSSHDFEEMGVLNEAIQSLIEHGVRKIEEARKKEGKNG